MAQEDAKRLIERMDRDEAFRAKLLAAPDVAARLEFAAAEGYDVSEAEIEHASAVLSDAELNGVAGGECFGGYAFIPE